MHIKDNNLNYNSESVQPVKINPKTKKDFYKNITRKHVAFVINEI